MAPTKPSRPGSKGEEAGQSKLRINTIAQKRGKYQPRKLPPKLETVGQRIRAGRVALGLNQIEMAERLHTHQTSVSAWERGKGNIAGPSLVALAELLQTTPEALLTGAGFEVPQGLRCLGSPSQKHGETADNITLPPDLPEGHLAWIEHEHPDEPHVLKATEALQAIKRALAAKRRVWVVVK